jgi:hypothetical protein
MFSAVILTKLIRFIPSAPCVSQTRRGNDDVIDARGGQVSVFGRTITLDIKGNQQRDPLIMQRPVFRIRRA